MATLYKTSGSVSNVQPLNGSYFELSELQGFVGGYIEIHRLADDSLLVVNEQGRLMGLPPNPNANEAFARIGIDTFQGLLKGTELTARFGSLVGNVLICSNSEII